MLSIDLKQAFDRVSREALTQALRNLGTDEATIAAVIAIHDTSCYHIQQQDTATSVRTTRGIRQGCRLAPMLWVVIATAILARLQEPLHRQGTTFADDTLCQWLISDPEDIHQLTAFLTLLLQVMEDLDLLVNLTKTVLLVRVRASAGQRAVRQRTCWKDGQRWWRVPTRTGLVLAWGPLNLPLNRQFYCGDRFLGVPHGRVERCTSRASRSPGPG